MVLFSKVRAHVMRSNVGGVTGGILADIAMLSMIPGDKTDNDTNGMKVLDSCRC